MLEKKNVAWTLPLTAIGGRQQGAWRLSGGVGEQPHQAGCGEGLDAEAEDACIRDADTPTEMHIKELKTKQNKNKQKSAKSMHTPSRKKK